MYLILITLPIFGSITSGFFGRKVGFSGSQLLSCICLVIITVISTVMFIEVGIKCISISMHLIKWIEIETVNIYWNFNYDSLTVSMLIPVLIVSFLVHVYSKGYMDNDPHIQRFFSYLSLFTFMMIMLVASDNALLMFVGWEGVGICSYLLVSFWFTRIEANKSSISAFLTNRVGDCFLTIGMFIIILSISSLQYYIVFSVSAFISENVITVIGICLLIGAMAKSSQVGLHVWLPMAMEGPTPVSALIHAATMVTAGVYLLMRFSPLLEYSTTVLSLCLWIGVITTIFSSLIGLFQQDIKKVIAYSTMSQLGMMVLAIGLSSYNIALFHLVNHAFYKALLFLGAGAVIHSVSDNQDFRKYGGLISYLPLTYTVMLIASFSLVAIPFMTGFYSKDLILESSYAEYNIFSVIIYAIAVLGAMFTTLYSAKLLYLTFLSNPNGPEVNYKEIKPAHEGNIFINIPLIILAIFSIYFGFLTKDIFIGLGSGFFSDNSLFIHPLHEILLNTEFSVPTSLKLLPLLCTVCLSFISIALSEYYPKLITRFKSYHIGYIIFSFLSQRFYIELINNRFINKVLLNLGGQTMKIMDKGLIELIGPFGIKNFLINLSRNINNLSTGIVTHYALYILIGLVFYISIFYFIYYMTNFKQTFMLAVSTLICVISSFRIISKPYKFVNLNRRSEIIFPISVFFLAISVILIIIKFCFPNYYCKFAKKLIQISTKLFGLKGTKFIVWIFSKLIYYSLTGCIGDCVTHMSPPNTGDQNGHDPDLQREHEFYVRETQKSIEHLELDREQEKLNKARQDGQQTLAGYNLSDYQRLIDEKRATIGPMSSQLTQEDLNAINEHNRRELAREQQSRNS